MNPGQVITDIYKEMLAFLASKAGVLVPDGQDLAGVLLLIVVSWSVLMWLTKSVDRPDICAALRAAMWSVVRSSTAAVSRRLSCVVLRPPI